MTIRILYFTCFALLVCATLALYQTSERTRTVKFALARAEQSILDEQVKRGALQAEYEHLARPDRVQALAESRLGMTDTATVQLASLSLLPRRGDDAAGAQPIADSAHNAVLIPASSLRGE